MSETIPQPEPAEPAAAEPPVQPPYLLMANAMRSPDVLDVAEHAAMRAASMVATVQRGPLPGEPTEPAMPDQVRAARFALARMIAGRTIPQRVLAIGLLQAPDVIIAIASDPSNVAQAMLGADLAAAWARNWTDYALLQALVAPAAPPAGV